MEPHEDRQKRYRFFMHNGRAVRRYEYYWCLDCVRKEQDHV